MPDGFIASDTGFGRSDGIYAGYGQGGIFALFNNADKDSDAKIKVTRINYRSPTPHEEVMPVSSGGYSGRFSLARISDVTGGEPALITSLNSDDDEIPAGIDIRLNSDVTATEYFAFRGSAIFHDSALNAVNANIIGFGLINGRLISYGLTNNLTQAIKIREGEGIALTHKVGSQNFFPRPRSFLLVVLLKINGIHYTIKRPVLGFPRSTFAFISIMNNVGSGAVVEVYEMRFEQLGALWMGSAVFEDQPILNLIRMTRPQGGEPVTPVGIAGETPNSDIVLLNGCIDSPIRYTPVLSNAYNDPFADTLNGYGALVTTSTIWLSQGNPNVKEFPGSIRRSLELLNVAPGATNNNKLAHDFAPQYNERFGARGDIGRAITLNAQEGIVLANQRTLASAAEYYWEVEFQYIEPSDQFPTVAYAFAM